MSSGSVKKVLLGVLALVAVYVWWGNLQLLTSDVSVEQPDSPSDLPTKTRETALAYQAPKVNPFAMTQEEEANATDTLPALNPPFAPESAGKLWQLVGVVKTKKRSTAVFVDHKSETMVCEIGDTLGLWKVQAITEKYAITSQDHWRDTLWLRGIERK